jgi:hypothetical protein
MEKRLKQCLGIDVSKLKLSLSLGFLTGKLEKEFISHEYVSNDLWGYKTLLKWLKKLVDSSVYFLILMYNLWKNEQVYDAKFETKKQQKHEAPAAQETN